MLRALTISVRRALQSRPPSIFPDPLLPIHRPFSTTHDGDDSDTKKTVPPSPKRNAATAADDEDDEDQFAFDDFASVLAEDEEKIAASLSTLAEAPTDLTPELASSLVEKLVHQHKTHQQAPTAAIIPGISPHTISVLRACRISTNTVQAAGTGMYEHPITKKVVLTLDIQSLGLSQPCKEAVKVIAGSRVKGETVRFAADQFTMREENHAYAVSLADRLVAAAKRAVGEHVDDTPIASWDDVQREVQRQGVAQGWDGSVVQRC